MSSPRFISSLICLSCLAFIAGAARADITPYWQHVAITATTDPSGANLEGFQCWDLRVSLSGFDQFGAMRIFSDPAGEIFHHARGDNSLRFGPPNPQLFAQYPALVFDSYLRGPLDGLTIVGSTDGTNDLPPPAVFDHDRLAVVAGFLTPVVHPPDVQLVRLTFSGPTPAVLGRVYSVQNAVDGVAIPPIPEPASAALALFAAMLVITPLRRRRQRTRPNLSC